MAKAKGPWSLLGTPAPGELTDARLQAHWAAQIVAAAGHTHLAPRADDSHTSLDWLPGMGAMVGQPMSGEAGSSVRSGLRLGDGALVILGADDRVADEMPLAGRTLDQGYRWMGERLAEMLGGGAPGELRRRDYEMPGHPVEAGAPFSAPSPGLAELARWFDAAFAALVDAAAEGKPDASPIRCWPHHFDLAVLLTIRPGDPPATIGIGLSPGDGSYPEPYWYVTPYPYPPRDVLPPLSGGAWHDRGWFGAVLRGGEIVQGPPGRRAAVVADFLASATRACRALLAGG